MFAIRKPAIAVFTLDDYVAAGVMTARRAAVLRRGIIDRSNIPVAGGTSTGKTTLSNALLAEIATYSDRVVLIEFTRELPRNGWPLSVGIAGRFASDSARRSRSISKRSMVTQMEPERSCRFRSRRESGDNRHAFDQLQADFLKHVLTLRLVSAWETGADSTADVRPEQVFKPAPRRGRGLGECAGHTLRQDVARRKGPEGTEAAATVEAPQAGKVVGFQVMDDLEKTCLRVTPLDADDRRPYSGRGELQKPIHSIRPARRDGSRKFDVRSECVFRHATRPCGEVSMAWA